MTIRTVLIDIDNTLLDFDKSAEIAMHSTAEKHCVILPENSVTVFREVNERLWRGLENGELTKQDIYDRRWKEIFDQLGVTADFHAFEDTFRQQMRVTAVPVEGAEDILSYLSEKYPVYSASNASRLQQEARLIKTGLLKYLSGMFTSEEIGFGKPAKEFFHACVSELYPVKPSEIIMIGDSINADITGAKSFGLKSIWFNFYNKKYDNYNFTDFHVTKLEEIKKIL